LVKKSKSKRKFFLQKIQSRFSMPILVNPDWHRLKVTKWILKMIECPEKIRHFDLITLENLVVIAVLL